MMAIDFNQQVHIPAHVIFRELQGEAVVLNLENERYYGLDDIGTRIWSLLAQSTTLNDVYETLLGEYDVDPDSLHRDITALIEQLQEQDLVILSDASQ
jgi:hypothetical protein